MGFGCVAIIVPSAVLEILGLSLVAVDLWRLQLRELGTPQWVRRLQAVARRLLGRPPRTVALGASLKSAAHISAAMRVRRAPGTTVDERLASLEANLESLHADTSDRFADMEQRLTAVHERVDEARAHVEALRRQQQEARREELRKSMPLQWLGTALFAAGALLEMWVNFSSWLGARSARPAPVAR